MDKIDRRRFLKLAGFSLASSALFFSTKAFADSQRIVIVGGGIAGTTAAIYLKTLVPNLSITLIEKNTKYTAGIMSNEVIAGLRDISSITFGYENLNKINIKLINDAAVEIDTNDQLIHGKKDKYKYDRLILAPGISLDWQSIQGIDNAKNITGWQRGVDVTTLKEQITNIKNGGNILISIPKGPISGPAAPYERASLIAHYLKSQKSKSKLFILDGNSPSEQTALFKSIWSQKYKDLIELQTNTTTEGVDVGNKTIITNQGKIKGEVINIIPAQRANLIAQQAALTDKDGWCPVDQRSFSSTKADNVHILGDAISPALGLRKTAQCANSQAKHCALAIAATITNNETYKRSMPLIDVEYSIIAPSYAISTVQIHKQAREGLRYQQLDTHVKDVKVADKAHREYGYAVSWFNNITQEIFA